MNQDSDSGNRRILLIDDNPAIHQDFQKIFGGGLRSAAALSESEAALFGVAKPVATRPAFHDSAREGQQGVELVRRAAQGGEPYAMAFVDVRMPSGWDGIETVARLWEVDPNVQIVICTAYSDYSWEQIRERLVHAERFIVLKEPFDTIEVLQLAESLTEQWRLARHERCRVQDLERRIREHHEDLQAVRSISEQLDAANRRLTARGCSAPCGQERRALEEDLRRALRTRESTVDYQPLVEIASRQVVVRPAGTEPEVTDIGRQKLESARAN